MDMREFLIVRELVKVKSKRMDKSAALKEALKQRYAESMTIDYLDDLYQAAVSLDKEYDWFKREVDLTVKAMQNS